jgi:hypothetical protein
VLKYTKSAEYYRHSEKIASLAAINSIVGKKTAYRRKHGLFAPAGTYEVQQSSLDGSPLVCGNSRDIRRS